MVLMYIRWWVSSLELPAGRRHARSCMHVNASIPRWWNVNSNSTAGGRPGNPTQHAIGNQLPSANTHGLSSDKEPTGINVLTNSITYSHVTTSQITQFSEFANYLQKQQRRAIHQHWLSVNAIWGHVTGFKTMRTPVKHQPAARTEVQLMSKGFTSQSKHNRSFRTRSSKPISWHSTEETKPNKTKANKQEQNCLS